MDRTPLLTRVSGRTAVVAVGICIVAATASVAVPAAMQTQPSSQAEVARAELAMNALQQALLTKLRSAMDQGGPAAAVVVCRDEARGIGDRLAHEYGIQLGRTSHRVRNPANAPRDWAKAIVAGAAGAKASAERLRVVDLGDRVGVLRPIGTIDMCTRCHGGADVVRENLGAALAQSYPQDQATGFGAGDLRGWMWAEVPKLAR
jgi:hypothetical protein